MMKTNTRMTIKTAVDGGTVVPGIMAELLNQPGVKEQVAKMTPDELVWYKDLLVSEGIYADYVKERANSGDKT